MTHRKNLDPNAKAALEQYRYEIANELGANDTKGNPRNKNTNKLAEAAKNQMGNQTEFRRK